MTHPYIGLPDRQFWRKDPGIADPARFDPVSTPPFLLGATDRIVTAGSCFAQHLAAKLAKAGLHHFVTETAHPIFPPVVARAHNFGQFSARYGNVYTTRQLLQLLQRAYGTFVPREQFWRARDGAGVVDPFRPQIQPGNFLGPEELEADRRQHFARVREAIEKMDCFVFTLGLTECWEDTRDGAVFPLAPGVAGGDYDVGKVRFRNFDEVEAYGDLAQALTFIRKVNPAVKIILTVSPVPLNATFEDRHVFVSTTWSKAVLRIVAEKAVRAFENCAYFPSYEIITSPHVGARYYAEDRREVLPKGVAHVMRLFFRHYVEQAKRGALAGGQRITRQTAPSPLEEMQRRSDILCDELALDNLPAAPGGKQR